MPTIAATDQRSFLASGEHFKSQQQLRKGSMMSNTQPSTRPRVVERTVYDEIPVGLEQTWKQLQGEEISTAVRKLLEGEAEAKAIARRVLEEEAEEEAYRELLLSLGQWWKKEEEEEKRDALAIAVRKVAR